MKLRITPAWTELAEAMEAADVSVAELADRLQVHRQVIYRWLRRQKRPRYSRVPQIAKALAPEPKMVDGLSTRLLKSLAQ